MRVSDGKTTYYSSWREYVDFKRIKATGWKKSVINNNPTYQLPYWGGEIDVINNDKNYSAIYFFIFHLFI